MPKTPETEGGALSPQAQAALSDLRLTMEAKRVPEEERQGYVDNLTAKVAGQEDGDMIDLALGNVLLEITKKSKQS